MLKDLNKLVVYLKVLFIFKLMGHKLTQHQQKMITWRINAVNDVLIWSIVRFVVKSSE